MRNTFVRSIVELAKTNTNICFMVGDLGYGAVEPFMNAFPDRFINAGIAEQNMMGMAAGMAMAGKHVFVYSIANFPTFRCAEQIRNDVAYHNLPVTVVSVGGGAAYGSLGYSHHAVQDYALLRSFPNMLVAAPGDPLEVQSCVEYLTSHPQPSYLRLNKAGEPIVIQRKKSLEPGKLNYVHKSTKNERLILTTGSIVGRANEIFNISNPIRNKWSLATMPLWGEQTKIEVCNSLSGFKEIVTIEEHLHAGGFGSYIREAGLTVRNYCLRSDVTTAVGNQDYLLDEYGLNLHRIVHELEESK